MPFALAIIGVILVVVAVRNTQDDFSKLVIGDFSGPGNFFWWLAAILMIGAIGYIQKLKPISDGLLALVLVALLLTRGSPSFPGGGFFAQLTNALKGTQVAAPGGGSVLADVGIPDLTGSTPSPGPGGSTIYTFPGGGRIRIDPHFR